MSTAYEAAAPEAYVESKHQDRNPVVERLQTSLSEAHRAGESVGLLLVHVAAVDRIDALHGFHAGDRMSNSVAQVLRTKALRKRDLVESLSRDEFACVLRPAPSEGIAMLAANRVMLMLGSPMDFSGMSVTPDAAVGIAMFPEQAADAGQLEDPPQVTGPCFGIRGHLADPVPSGARATKHCPRTQA